MIGDPNVSQLTYQGIMRLHELRRNLVERAFYPAHDKRTESPEYAKVHRQMVVVEDLPCLACGVKQSTLGSPANRWHAKAIETHHHTIEWALANGIDLAKFNARIVAKFRCYPSHDPMYDNDFTRQQMLDWIDHGRDNLWPLCDVHHRHKWFGIHAVTYPIWGPQDLLTDEFLAQVMQETGVL
ncbi:MAG: hypothetical protein M0Z43_06010 [Acidithiobacillus sp.]|nr:hypothetical protein [Acidithiobacillus sp.]